MRYVGYKNKSIVVLLTLHTTLAFAFFEPLAVLQATGIRRTAHNDRWLSARITEEINLVDDGRYSVMMAVDEGKGRVRT